MVRRSLSTGGTRTRRDSAYLPPYQDTRTNMLSDTCIISLRIFYRTSPTIPLEISAILTRRRLHTSNCIRGRTRLLLFFNLANQRSLNINHVTMLRVFLHRSGDGETPGDSSVCFPFSPHARTDRIDDEQVTSYIAQAEAGSTSSLSLRPSFLFSFFWVSNFPIFPHFSSSRFFFFRLCLSCCHDVAVAVPLLGLCLPPLSRVVCCLSHGWLEPRASEFHTPTTYVAHQLISMRYG